MEVDIEICLSNVTRDEASSLAKRFFIKHTNKDVGALEDIIVRQEADNRTGIVGHIVCDFLSNLASFSETIESIKAYFALVSSTT